MAAPEPIHRPVNHANAQRSSPYDQGRWRWWYSAIADWMLRHPGGSMKECALALGRGTGTVSAITSSDTFKTYYAQRKQDWQDQHDGELRTRLHSVALEGLDTILAVIKKKGDTVPLDIAMEVANSALDRLGFAPNTPPSVQLNINSGSGQQVNLQGVSPQALAEARDALRRVESMKTIPIPTSVVGGTHTVEGQTERGLLAASVVGAQVIEGQVLRPTESTEPSDLPDSPNSDLDQLVEWIR